MIQPIGNIVGATGRAGDDQSIVPLEQRLALAQTRSSQQLVTKAATIEPATSPLASAFLTALRSLPHTGDVRRDADAVGRLLREFADPASGKPAFSSLKEQSDILQLTLEHIEPDDGLSKALQTTMIGTENLSMEMKKWVQDVCSSDGTPKEAEDW